MLNQTCGLPTPTRRIHWTNVGTDTIGRINPKTQNLNQSFINTNDVGFGWPSIVATSTGLIT
jgi:hypothetical protein